MPSISFVIPSYNYARYICVAVESVLPAMEDADELIVVDDGSADDTRQVLSHWIEKNTIQYVYQDNAGVSAARNTGARLASSDYLYFLDADDRIILEGFSNLREEIGAQQDKAMIFGGHCSVDEGNRRCHPQSSVSDNAPRNFIDYVINRRFSIANGGAVLIKRAVALKYAYPEDLKVSEDFCVYAWVLANENVAAIPDEIVEVTKHNDSLRNQTMDYPDIVERLPIILFDSARIPMVLLKYKQRFYCNRLLSLFRAQYFSGENKEAKATYKRAVHCRLLNLFKTSYFKKYIHLVMMK